MIGEDKRQNNGPLNIAPTKHAMKIEYAPIDRDTLVRRMGLMHKLFAQHLLAGRINKYGAK